MVQSFKNFPPMTDEEYYNFLCETQNKKTGNLSGETYDCTQCFNKGYNLAVNQEKDGYNAKICPCVDIRNGIKQLKDNHLDYSNLKMSKFIVIDDWQKDFKSKAQAFLNTQNTWFFVGGISGSGKTHICTAITTKLLFQGKRIKYLKWVAESEKLKYLRSEIKEYDRQIDIIKNVDVLYIDDFFKIKDTDKLTNADLKIAMEIIDYRYISKKTTIISSELNINQIIDIDMAIGGRILEMTKEFCIAVKNERDKNYRLRGQ